MRLFHSARGTTQNRHGHRTERLSDVPKATKLVRKAEQGFKPRQSGPAHGLLTKMFYCLCSSLLETG